MQENTWNYEQDLSNIGGVIGLSTQACEKCTSIWRQSPYYNHPFSLVLAPENDFEWYYKYTGKTSPAKTSSVLTFDTSNEKGTGGKVTLQSSDSNEWRFKASSFKFFETELVGDVELVDISLGVSGLGFPETEYMTVAKKLYGLNSKI